MAEAHIYIYGGIGQDGVNTESVRLALEKAKSADKIILHVSSQGGEVYEGYTIYNLLKNSGKKIETIIEGFCASIATLVALAGDTVTMNETASFMIHNPFVGIEGDADALRKAADHLDAIKNELIRVYSAKTGLNAGDLWEMMNKETYFTATAAKEIGFATATTEAFKAVAFFDPSKLKSNQNNMQDKTLLEEIRKGFSSIKNMFAGVRLPKNMDVKLKDGTTLYIDSEDGDVTGKSVFVVDADGNQTPAPDGTHMLEDGRAITVAGGIIESVEEAPMDAAKQIEELTANNKKLEEELASANETIKNLSGTVENTQAAFAELELKVENLLKATPAGATAPKFKATFKPVDKNHTPVKEDGVSSWFAGIIKERAA